MRNLIASAIVALLVSVAVSGASTGPSDSQRLAALSARLDKVQVRLADTRAIAQEARTEAEDALQVTACITGGIWMSEDPDTADWWNGDGTEPDAALVATLDASCAGAAS